MWPDTELGDRFLESQPLAIKVFSYHWGQKRPRCGRERDGNIGMRLWPCSQSNASLLSGPGPSLPGLRDPPPDKYVPPQTEKRRGASISESFFTSLSSSYAQCMHGEDWVLNLLGSPLASSPVSKSFPNRSVGKKPSHRPLTVNTIILHIQMRITPG